MTTKRLIVGLTGATGVVFGVRLLEMLRRHTDVETHLVMSQWAARTLVHETNHTPAEVEALAHHVHHIADHGAPISSGSFLTDGMVIAPCSVRTLSSIASGAGYNLLHRAADVVLKERRRLVLAVRETPLNDIHLEHMLKLSRMGAVVAPPLPAFYHRPRSLDEVVDHTVMRLLDQFGLHLEGATRWDGLMDTGGDRTGGGRGTAETASGQAPATPSGLPRRTP
ncbi:MAG: UbiX family flavin prenyltransferase [Vicinamibacterales bacterium]